MYRGEVEVEEARQTRTRRASIFTTDKERNEYEVMRTVYSVAQLVRFVRERTCETLPRMSNK